MTDTSLEHVVANHVGIESTKMIVPGWWRAAFEKTVLGKFEDEQGAGFKSGSLIHTFDPQELALLAVVLGELQRKVFLNASSNHSVELDWHQLQRSISATDQGTRLKLWKVLQGVSQLRFVFDSKESSQSVVPIFKGEQQRPYYGEDQPFQLGLEFSDRGLELLSGHVDAHVDLLADLNGSTLLGHSNFISRSMVLWAPLWLDLNLNEQVIYTRMEHGMQQADRWCRLDGLVGMPLMELTHGLRFPKKSQEQNSLLLERLKVIGKIGRRLVAHGLIQREILSDYIAVRKGGAEHSPLLLFQASAERLKSRVEQEFFSCVAVKVFQNALEKFSEPLISMFSSLSQETDVRNNLRRALDEIRLLPGCSLELGNGLTVQGHFLFLEWMARSSPHSLLRLPSSLLGLSGNPFSSWPNAGNYAEKYKAWLSWVGHLDFARLLERKNSSEIMSIADGSLAPDFKRLLASQVQKYQMSGFISDLTHAKPQVVHNKVMDTRVDVESVHARLVKPAGFDKTAQKLRRVAQDELEKMIKLAPDSYRDLKLKFLQSLDGETREMFSDVQRRLNVTEFDRHLKPRLVRYMVDHPGSWASVSGV